LSYIAVVGDDEGNLLALEADLVGGEHGLGVAREGRHPGQSLRLEVRPRDDGVDSWQLQRGGDVYVVYLRVGKGASYDGRVEHALKPDVVHVLSLAPDKAPVLLARHPIA
jgi:hypothetical protein